MALVYATVDDLLADNWLEQAPPGNVEALLRSASALVAEATITAWYRTSPDGTPIAGPVADAMRDATCAHVAALIATGVDPLTGVGTSRIASSKGVGSARVTYADADQVAAARARLAAALHPDAVRILTAAGLTSSVLG